MLNKILILVNIIISLAILWMVYKTNQNEVVDVGAKAKDMVGESSSKADSNLVQSKLKTSAGKGDLAKSNLHFRLTNPFDAVMLTGKKKFKDTLPIY